jgi:hypothetical protein
VPEGSEPKDAPPLTPTTAQTFPNLGNGLGPNNDSNNKGLRHSLDIERDYKSAPIDIESLHASAEMPLSPRTQQRLWREKEDKIKEERAEKSRAQVGMLFPGFFQWPLVHRLLFDSDPKMQKIFK